MSDQPSKKARSLQQENRVFQSDWEEKYFQVKYLSLCQISLQRNYVRSAFKKVRSLQHENRVFQSDWEEKYFQVEVDNKAHCLLCPVVISSVKSFNIKRHYETHSTKYDCYQGESRKRKLESLKSAPVMESSTQLPSTSTSTSTAKNFEYEY